MQRSTPNSRRFSSASAEAIRATADALLAGGVAVMPTDTVYGLAAHPSFPAASSRIYDIKGRRQDKPIALLASDADAPTRLGAAMPPMARALAERFWPGALTLVLDVPNGTEGFRVPDSDTARAIIASCGGLLRVTSANFSGEPAVADFAEIPESLVAQCDAAVDGGPCPGGVPSAVIKFAADGAVDILREGPHEITDFIRSRMRFLVSAGPTREFIDPVRFISNRSTGRMGFAVAAAAAAAGHEVTLVAGPVTLPTPEGVRRIDVVTARDMLAALEGEIDAADALVMTAAVADWRPAETASAKLKKREMSPSIALVPNPDILKALAPHKGKRVFVGFAAETGGPDAEAARKLDEKNLDFICANDVTRPGAGFGTETNIVTIFGRGGFREDMPLMAKSDIAKRIIELAERKWTGKI